MARLTKCPVCEKLFDRDKEEFEYYKNRYYHLKCFNQKYKDDTARYQLEDYIKKIYNLDFVNPLIRKQIKEFNEQGMSYTGMYKTLYYFYDIQKNDPSKAKGIGIIEYVYDEAKKYYEELYNIEYNNKDITTPIEKQINIYINKPIVKPMKKRKIIKLKEDDDE